MKRRDTLTLGASLGLPTLAGASAAAATTATAAGLKVLRLALPAAETGFDPVRVSDIYSASVNNHIFEAPFEYDHLARPARIKPRTAASMAESSADFRQWTVRLAPGTFFADDPAFKGRKRELVAQDYVFTIKRFADPANKSPYWSSVDAWRLVGLAGLRQRALKDKTPFDYDSPIEGLRAVDRYTLQFTLERPLPRFVENLASSATYGAVAREVVEAYGDAIMGHPVGTGPYRLASWRRSSQIVLERNPQYRTVLWQAEPAPDDAEGQAIAKQLSGRRLPLVDRVELSVIDEAQPRWLSFLNGQSDLVSVPQEFAQQVMPFGRLAPHLARRGVRGQRTLVPFTQLSFFNMEHPVVGGNAPAQVALRRAVWLAMDVQREIDLVFRGQATQAESMVPPHCSGYRAGFKSENSDHDVARAQALLELYGWVDRDGDGWREQPDGQPLLLECSTEPQQLSRARDELLKRSLDRIGIRSVFKTAQWPENLKSARAGKLMMWRIGSSATQPDGQDVLRRLYGPEAGQGNLARFKLPAFDEVFERMAVLPDGPQRDALFEQARRIGVAYAPYKVHLHQYVDSLTQPWLIGYRRPVFWHDWWHKVDIDTARQAQGV